LGIQLVLAEKNAFESCGVSADDVVASYEKGESFAFYCLDGLFGSDRMYLSSIDANEYGMKKSFDTTDLLMWPCLG